MAGSTRSTPFGTFNSSSACASSSYNEGAGGAIGWNSIVADTAGTVTTENAIVINSVPVNTSRLLSIRATGTFRATGPTGIQVLIIEDSTTILRTNTSVSAGGVDLAFAVEAFSFSPSNGNHDYTLAYGISGAGGQTVGIIATPDTPCQLVVEDIGPAF